MIRGKGEVEWRGRLGKGGIEGDWDGLERDEVQGELI